MFYITLVCLIRVHVVGMRLIGDPTVQSTLTPLTPLLESCMPSLESIVNSNGRQFLPPYDSSTSHEIYKYISLKGVMV